MESESESSKENQSLLKNSSIISIPNFLKQDHIAASTGIVDLSLSRPGKAQTNQLEFLKDVISSTMRHKLAWPFRIPVDAEKLNIPDYPTIIHAPMDLTTIKNRLRDKFYYSASECLADISRMFVNCYIFNRPNEDVVNMAHSLEIYFRQKLNRGFPTVEINKLSTNESPIVVYHTRRRDMQLNNLTEESCSTSSQTSPTKITQSSNSSLQTLDESGMIMMNDTNIISPSSTSSTIQKRRRRRKASVVIDIDSTQMCFIVLSEIMSSKYTMYNQLFMESNKMQMNLRLMMNKLEMGEYSTTTALAADFESMISYCIKLFGRDSRNATLAQTLRRVFYQTFDRLSSTWMSGNGSIKIPYLTPEEEEELKNLSMYVYKPNSCKSDEERRHSDCIQEFMNHLNIDLTTLQTLLMIHCLPPLTKSILSLCSSSLDYSPTTAKKCSVWMITPLPTERRNHIARCRRGSKWKNTDHQRSSSPPSSFLPPSSSSTTCSPQSSVMSYAEKRLLSELIKKLPDSKLELIVEIIRRYEPTPFNNSNELVIDFQQLQEITLRKIEAIVNAYNGNNSLHPASSVSTTAEESPCLHPTD